MNVGIKATTTEKIILISNFPVQSTNRKSLSARLLSTMTTGEKTVLFFANTNFIVKCRFLLERKMLATVILVNDGVGMDIAAKLFHGERFESNLNGTDFTPFLFNESPQPLRVFMLGGKPDVLEKAVRHVEDNLMQKVVGSCDGYQHASELVGLVAKINAVEPDVVLVAMGNPMQEKWIAEHCDAINAKLFMGVGALFDFWSGDKPRAPDMVRSLRLEWFYRLCLEPRRLMRRYTIEIIIFLSHCIKYR